MTKYERARVLGTRALQIRLQFIHVPLCEWAILAVFIFWVPWLWPEARTTINSFLHSFGGQNGIPMLCTNDRIAMENINCSLDTKLHLSGKQV
jgi:hypothetical protein